jgi:hypothetical protein
MPGVEAAAAHRPMRTEGSFIGSALTDIDRTNCFISFFPIAISI